MQLWVIKSELHDTKSQMHVIKSEYHDKVDFLAVACLHLAIIFFSSELWDKLTIASYEVQFWGTKNTILSQFWLYDSQLQVYIL